MDGLEIKGKRVLVVGLGKSGVASALFLRGQGARVTVSDAKSEDQLRQEIPVLLDRGIVVETGRHGERTFRDQDLIVVSPGVPSHVAPLEQARRRGIPVIGEIELAYRFLPGHIAAITGSNGKTTTTTLTGEIIASGGGMTLVGGNIGTPAVTFVEQSSPETWVVLEVSSFQLETVDRFRPRIAAVLNITPDHLDRHGSMEGYIAAKARIFENQTAEDFAVLNADDANAAALAPQVKAQLYWFSRVKEVERGAFVREGKILFRDAAGEREIAGAGEIALKGAHNVENVLAAVTIGVLSGVEAGKIARAVRNFRAVEHRLEFTAEVAGVQYFNDSKATNVDATIKALESFPGGVHLILGGKHKGSPYTVLRELIDERVKGVYTIGVAASIIEQDLRGCKAPLYSCGTLEAALRRASGNAVAGDVVLLAPACSSFDQFDSYEQRGRVFKDLVAKMAGEARSR
jgi:UDP-N-acetylmuramoylalanine--D-glutamate ligase